MSTEILYTLTLGVDAASCEQLQVIGEILALLPRLSSSHLHGVSTAAATLGATSTEIPMATKPGFPGPGQTQERPFQTIPPVPRDTAPTATRQRSATPLGTPPRAEKIR